MQDRYGRKIVGTRRVLYSSVMHDTLPDCVGRGLRMIILVSWIVLLR